MPSTTQHKITELTLVGLALIGPLLAINEHRAIVPVCAIAAIIIFFSIGPKLIWEKFLQSNKVLIVTAMLFLALIGISTLWAPDLARGTVTLGKVLGSFLIGTILIMIAKSISVETARRVAFSFAASILILISFIAIDALTNGLLSFYILQKGVGIHYGHFWLKPAAALIAIGIWPLALYFWKRGYAWLALCFIGISALSGYAIGANGVMVAILGGAVIGLVYSVLGAWRKKITMIAFIIFAGIVLFQPLIIKNIISPQAVGEELTLHKPIAGSTLYRLYIWDFVSDRISEKPILGWGIGASRHIGDQVTIHDPKWGEIGEAVPLHPHNSFLQLQLELGVMGLVLGLIVIGLALRLLNRIASTTAQRFAGMGLFISLIFQYSISFSVWSSWWNAAVILSLAMMVVAWRIRDAETLEA